MKPGLLVISHGSRDAGWVAQVEAAVAAARAALSAVSAALVVEAAYLELVEGRLIQDGIDRLEAAGATRLFALPLFVSSGSTHVDEIGWSVGAYAQARTETDLVRCRVGVPLDYGSPLDDDPELIDILLARAAALAGDKRACVLLVGHGSAEPSFLAAWERGLSAAARQLAARGGYAACAAALLLPDQVSGRVRELRERHPGVGIVVVPVMLSEGFFTKTMIPQRLAGLDCRYDGRTLLPHPAVAGWIVRRTREWLGRAGAASGPES